MKMKLSKTIALFAALTTVAFFTATKVSFAQTESSPSADNGEASPSAQTTQTLKDRIEKIVQEKSEQIKGTMDELSKQKKGFIAEVERVSEETITLKNNKGTTIIPIDEQVTLVKKQKQIELDQIAIGDWAIVMGYMEDDTLSARRIVFSAESLMPKSPIVDLGSIKAITAKKLDFKPRIKEETVTLTINSKTNFEDYEGNEAKLSDFSEDIQCLIVGFEDDKGKVVTTIRALAPFFQEELDE